MVKDAKTKNYKAKICPIEGILLKKCRIKRRIDIDFTRFMCTRSANKHAENPFYAIKIQYV